MSQDAEAAARQRQGSGRAIGFYVLLLLATLLLILSAFAIWVNRVALNTQVFTESSTALIEDDAIRTAVAARSVDELFDSVDVEAEIKDQLPESVEGLAAPMTAGLHQAAYTLVERALEQPALQRVWTFTLEQTHRQFVDVLEGGGRTVSTEGGVVTLDLEDLVLEAASRIGIRSQVEDNLPAGVGQIEVLRSDELDTAQNAARLLKTLAWVLPLFTLGLFVVSSWLAHDRRRAVRAIGVAVLIAGALGLVAVRLAGGYVVDSLVTETQNRAAGDAAWDIMTDLLRATFVRFVVFGALFILAAWLLGPGRRAASARGMLAPVFRERVWVYAAYAVIVLVLVFVSPVRDLTRALFLLTIIVLIALWIEVMRRQTTREFPDAEAPAVLTDAWTRITSWWEQLRAAPPVVPTTPRPSAGTTDLTARLAELADLHGRGELTDAEYASAKARVLAGD